MRTGLEVLHDDDFRPLAGQRVALMTSPGAVDHRLRSAYDLFTRSAGVNLVALFSPEHGLSGVEEAGELIASSTDARTGLPVYSLHGDTFRPTADMLAGVDVIVCDVQDIGVRYYTYPWTITHIIEAAGEYGVRVLILDRPNPLGGIVVDGPLLDRHLTSLVGRYPVPVRHGLTLGELMQMHNATWNPTPADLTVIPCDGWRRGMLWPDTGLPWVPPSPNFPQLATLAHYPGACLVEGTRLSEGRGTTLPFEIVGAPWIDGPVLADHLRGAAWGERFGAGFRPHSFRPTFEKWAGQVCHGVQVHVLDPARWRPLEVWIGLIAAIRTLYPERFEWLPIFEGASAPHFDLLIGSKWVRREIEASATAGQSIEALLARFAVEWADDSHAFEVQRQPFLLYD
ncbi:MAG: DUF1343 domain-containing protein [Chloroflexi bacterium]|nr:DUF1343 domain-containing protein [Chloroflexota bacterium]